MSFKSYDCFITGILPAGNDFNPSDEAVFIDGNDDIFLRVGCNPEDSNILGVAAPVSGMSESEFYELWGMLILVLVLGVGIKILARVFVR